MKKLILVLLAITISPYNFYAMEDERTTTPQCNLTTIKNSMGLAYNIPSLAYDLIDENSPFYHQNQADCTAQIKSAQNIIEQYQSLNNVYANVQSHKIKNHNELITQIAALHDKAQKEPSGIKAYDPLIQDQNILKYANMHQPISLEITTTYNLILLAQQYLASEHALSPTQKLVLCKQIHPLLITQPLLWQDLSQYSPQNLEAFSSFLPMIYDRIWNSHKFMITSRLLQTLNTEKLQQIHLTAEFDGINEMRTILQEQAAHYKNALAAINSKLNTALITEDVTTHHESVQLECMETDTQVTAITPTEIQPVIDNIELTVEPQIIETRSITESNISMNAPKKSTKLSKKQLAALALEKKTEQSRIDKERHRLALEQKNAAEESKKLAPITMPVVAAITKNNSSKSIQKKSVNKTQKKSEQKADEDFDAMLHDAIEEINSKSITKPLDSDILTAVKINEKSIEQPTDLIEYLEFIEARNIEIMRLQQAKDAQKKANLKKLCSVKSQDRERIKRELEIALNKDFSTTPEDEKEIIMFLNAYAHAIDIKNINTISLDNFKIIENKMIAAENHLQKKGSHFSWYLAAYPDTYSLIKERYIKFITVMQVTLDQEEVLLQNEYAKYPELTEIEKRAMREEMDAISPLHKQKAILASLIKLHTGNGIFDISRLIYSIKTRQELMQLGILNPANLQQLEKDIKSLYANKKSIDYSLIQPIIDNFLHQASITNAPKNMVRDMINMSAVIVKLNENKEELFSSLDTGIFYTLQRGNEMSITPLTDTEMADITKIHMTALSALIDIKKSKA